LAKFVAYRSQDTQELPELELLRDIVKGQLQATPEKGGFEATKNGIHISVEGAGIVFKHDKPKFGKIKNISITVDGIEQYSIDITIRIKDVHFIFRDNHNYERHVFFRNADKLIGSSESDALNSFLGADVVKGGVGDDWIDGNQGRDRLFGQEGSDVVFGGAASDFLDGGEGVNMLTGGPATDRTVSPPRSTAATSPRSGTSRVGRRSSSRRALLRASEKRASSKHRSSSIHLITRMKFTPSSTTSRREPCPTRLDPEPWWTSVAFGIT
jgi:hypothetical protein